MKLSVCIIYGINEGPFMGRPLVRALEQAGFTIAANPTQADVILAHSGGCFLIPQPNRAKLIVQVGIAYWPHKLWLASTVRKVYREGKLYFRQHRLREWAHKWLYHVRYSSLSTALRMLRSRPINQPWNSTQPQVIVRNHHDVYCSPEIYKVAFRGPRTFLSLPGEHDDCWEHPEPYVRLIQSLL
ncbi:MAG TPA: hypothetical protein VLF69_00325 [Candidatus Saccharimonadales bacterium]|nr:hypothetical protein [Candidatus Saccharimonadales bacterium]